MKNDFSEIQSEIDAMQPELVRIRRDLHRHPETGWLEMRTTAILAKELRAKRGRGSACRMRRF